MGNFYIRRSGAWDLISIDGGGPTLPAYGLRLKDDGGNWQKHVAPVVGARPLMLRDGDTWHTACYMARQERLEPQELPTAFHLNNDENTDEIAMLWRSVATNIIGGPEEGGYFSTGPASPPPFGSFFADSSAQYAFDLESDIIRTKTSQWGWIIYDLTTARNLLNGTPFGGYIDFSFNTTYLSQGPGVGDMPSGNMYLGYVGAPEGDFTSAEVTSVTHFSQTDFIGESVLAFSSTPQTLGTVIATFPIIDMQSSDEQYEYRYTFDADVAQTATKLVFSLRVDPLDYPGFTGGPGDLSTHQWFASLRADADFFSGALTFTGEPSI